MRLQELLLNTAPSSSGYAVDFMMSGIFGCRSFLKVIKMFGKEQSEFNSLDMLNILSFWIAILNLEQNIEQSRANDVNKANDKQQKEMLQDLHNEFEAQNERLSLIEHRLATIIQELGGTNYAL